VWPSGCGNVDLAAHGLAAAANPSSEGQGQRFGKHVSGHATDVASCSSKPTLLPLLNVAQEMWAVPAQTQVSVVWQAE